MADADVHIVQKTVESARVVDTVLVGDDTDLLVLLCFHASLDSHNIYFKTEPKKNAKKHQIWNITAVKEQLGPEMCSNILFLHAVLGCDTTSHICMASEKPLSLRSSSQADIFKNKQSVLLDSQLL